MAALGALLVWGFCNTSGWHARNNSKLRVIMRRDMELLGFGAEPFGRKVRAQLGQELMRRSMQLGPQSIRSIKAPRKTTILTIPFAVKNAALRRERSVGRTSWCSQAMIAAPIPTPA